MRQSGDARRQHLRPSSHDTQPAVKDLDGALRSGGKPLDTAVRSAYEPRFAFDFSRVRIFDDARAAASVRDVDARAYVVGSNIVFAAGQYDAESEPGRRLLAHELAHVAQDVGAHETSSASKPTQLSQRGDPEEVAAHAAANAVSLGDDVRVQAGSPNRPAVVHRWPWDDDSSAQSGSGDSGGSSLLGSAISAISTVGSDIAGGAKAAYGAYENATDFKGAANQLDNGIDWVEKKSAEGNQKMVDQTQGIPVLGELAKASAFLGTQATDLTGGLLKGAGDVVSGLGSAVFHPVDTAAGLEGIMEHNATVPFLSSTLKAGHGLYDLAVNGGGQYGSSLGDLANHVLNPLQSSQDDAKYDSDLARGILTPGSKSWDESWQRMKDNPMDTLGRAAGNIAPMLLGDPEAAAGEDTSQVAKVADNGPATLRTPYKPEGVPEPAPFKPDITGPKSDPAPPAPDNVPSPSDPGSVPPSQRPSYKPTGSRADWAWDPQQYPGDPVPSTPPGFEGQPRPYPVRQTPSSLPPDQIPDFGKISEPGAGFSGRPMNPVEVEPPSSFPGARDTIPDAPSPLGTPKLPGGPKEGPPIPREEPLSSPGDTVRQPMDIPGLPADEPLPSTQPRGPETQPAPASSGSDTPTLPGLGGMPAIPRGFDPGAVIQLLQDTPGAGSVVQLMQQLGMPVSRV